MLNGQCMARVTAKAMRVRQRRAAMRHVRLMPHECRVRSIGTAEAACAARTCLLCAVCNRYPNDVRHDEAKIPADRRYASRKAMRPAGQTRPCAACQCRNARSLICLIRAQQRRGCAVAIKSRCARHARAANERCRPNEFRCAMQVAWHSQR